MRDVLSWFGLVVVGLLATAAPASADTAPAVSAALKAADAPRSELASSAVETLPGGAVVSRFSQEVGGVPVVNAGAVVLDPVDGSPRLLFDKTREDVAAPGEARVSKATAVASAQRAIGIRKAAGAPTSRLVISGGKLAWEVAQPADAPRGDFVVTVDAASGKVLSKRNRIQSAEGEAQVFVPNAVVANGSYSGLKDRDDRDSANLTSLRTPVTLENIKDGQSCLRGDWVNVRVGAAGEKVCKDSLKWNNVTRSKNKFEALMAYYHIDQAQQYIQSLGLLPINEESQNVVVDSFGADNSFYSPGADEIQMGTGGVDDGEDADVFVHEYGHAVQNAQNDDAFPGSGNQAGAQGEGFGDYLAEAYSTETVGFDAEWSHCVMEWDATSYDNNSLYPPGICLRRTDNPDTLSEHKHFCGTNAGGGSPNEIHCVGEVWASALFELRTALGDDGGGDAIMDKVVLASHQLDPPSPSFQEASEALIAADESEYGVADHCTAIRSELVDRELLDGSFAC